MRRRRVGGAAVLATGLAAAGVAVLLTGGSATAAAPDASGYWWAQQTGTGPALPAPAAVPSGGLWVAYQGPQQTAQGQAAGGNEAVSALRLTATAGSTITSVTLTVDQSGGQATPQPVATPTVPAVPSLPVPPPVTPPVSPPTSVSPPANPAGPQLIACPTKAAWTAVQAGTWSQAPAASCSPDRAEGILSADGSSWTFNVGTLLDASGNLDVVIEPDPAGTAPFSVAFDPPGAAAITLTPDAGAPVAAGPPPPVSSFTAPVPPPVAIPPVPVPVATAAPASARPAPSTAPVATAPRPAGGPRQPVVLAALLLGAAVWVARYAWMARRAEGTLLAGIALPPAPIAGASPRSTP